jgi:hypothetical protein
MADLPEKSIGNPADAAVGPRTAVSAFVVNWIRLTWVKVSAAVSGNTFP